MISLSAGGVLFCLGLAWWLSGQAETSSLPLSLLPASQEHCVSTGKMPKMFQKSFGVGLRTLQGSAGVFLVQCRWMGDHSAMLL